MYLIICVSVVTEAPSSKDKDNDDKDSDRYLVRLKLMMI